jgi:hypothetical protein
LSLRRLVIGLLNDIVVPHLKMSGEQLQNMQIELKKVNGSLPAEERKGLEDRLIMLETWRRKKKIGPCRDGEVSRRAAGVERLDLEVVKLWKASPYRPVRCLIYLASFIHLYVGC